MKERKKRSPRVSREKPLLSERWFPHLPLALFVGLLGVLRIAPTVDQAVGRVSVLTRIMQAESRLVALSLHGLPDAVPGVFLVAMSVGLLVRSRLAWYITVVFMSVSLVVDLTVYRPPDRMKMVLCDVLLLAALFFWKKHFRRSSLAAATLFSVASILTLMGYALVGTYELGAHFSPKIEDLFTALYFVVVTMGTVGYGDIVPQTVEARMFVVSMVILGITVFATSLSAILAPLINKRMKQILERGESRMERAGHFILVGDTALSRNTYRELKARQKVVTMVLPSVPDKGRFDAEDLVLGDGSDLEVLKKAGAQNARALCALGDNDSENAFVVLAARELSSSITTVAGVSNTGNLARVRRVKPDIILSPQVLGASVLTMALSGEKMDAEDFMSRIFHNAGAANRPVTG
jgi:voltage-gated potassium channel